MQPAARQADPHVCPLVEGTRPPHGAVSFVLGSQTVTIGGQPALRATDTIGCPGAPNMITTGSGTVTIDGLPAARTGDPTAHGAALGPGDATVLIGG